MKDLKTLIAEAKKNALPLNFGSNSGHKNVILIEEDLHPMLKKLNKHRSNFDNRANCNDEPKDWKNFKNKMIINLETKRKEEWERQKKIDKMNESEGELEEINHDIESDSDSQKSYQIEYESQNEVDKIFGADDSDEDNENDKEVKKIKENNGEENQNFNNKIQEGQNDNEGPENEEEIEEETTTTKSSKSVSRIILDSDDEEEKNVLMSKRRPKFIEDDEEFDDNAMGFDSQGSSQEDKKFDFKSTIACPGGEVIFNAEPGDSNDLLQFCSGQFATQKFSETQVDDSNSISNDAYDLHSTSDVNDFQQDFETNQANYNDVDGESIVDERFENEEEDEENMDRKLKKHSKMRMKDFLEEEAEISGSEADVSSDESDNEDEYEVDEIQEDLPSDDEIRQQVERLYKKQELDEDKRQLLLLQERYLEDGDLHEDDNRVRKFKWNLQNNDDDNEFANILSDSDDDNSQQSDNDDYDDSVIVQFKRPVMKTEEYKEQIVTTTVEKLDSSDQIIETVFPKADESNSNSRVTFSQALQSTSMFRRKLVKQTKVTKVSAFFLKDDRLKTLLEKRSNPNSNNHDGPGPSKRSRLEENSHSKSIFDLL